MSYYEAAQVCLNGHKINSEAVSSPEHNEKFCSICGAETTTQCPNCKEIIRGYFHNDAGFLGYGSSYSVDITDFCFNCGKPFPWMEKKIDAAKELIDELDELESDDKEKLKLSLDDIVTDNPRNELASVRIKKILPKIGKPLAEALKTTIISIASEAAKKFLGM